MMKRQGLLLGTLAWRLKKIWHREDTRSSHPSAIKVDDETARKHGVAVEDALHLNITWNTTRNPQGASDLRQPNSPTPIFSHHHDDKKKSKKQPKYRRRNSYTSCNLI
jgi:hypothetical protein